MILGDSLHVIASLAEREGLRVKCSASTDEAQDISQAELRCLSALDGKRRNALCFAGDTAQRIFQQAFSWKSAGVEVRGQSANLKVNYRTSQEIREHADRLLDPDVTDGNGNVEDRRCTLSVFNGPPPEIRAFDNERHESQEVGEWLAEKHRNGTRVEEMAIFVRSDRQLARAERAARHACLPYQRLTYEMRPVPGSLPICPMHLEKGLEYRAVVVMACDQDAVPDPERIATATDRAELEEVYTGERQLLYVACTRARDALLVCGAGSASEFLEDMRA